MKISSEISVGLKRLSNSALVSDKNFDLVLSNLKDFFRNHSHAVDIPSNTVKVEIVKEAYAALFCFLVECVRRNEEVDSVSSQLETARFPPDKVDRILGLYLTNRQNIHRNLLYYGIKPHHLVNASWKMNFCVKSSFSSLEGSSVYYITLHVRDASSSSDQASHHSKVTFLCTVQHLQELVSSLRAAVRKLDTVAAISSAQSNQ